jgi:hypothetical protein
MYFVQNALVKDSLIVIFFLMGDYISSLLVIECCLNEMIKTENWLQIYANQCEQVLVYEIELKFLNCKGKSLLC